MQSIPRSVLRYTRNFRPIAARVHDKSTLLSFGASRRSAFASFSRLNQRLSLPPAFAKALQSTNSAKMSSDEKKPSEEELLDRVRASMLYKMADDEPNTVSLLLNFPLLHLYFPCLVHQTRTFSTTINIELIVCPSVGYFPEHGLINIFNFSGQLQSSMT